VEEAPTLDALHLLDVFVVDRVTSPVRIGRRQPLVGELMRDRTGSLFLSPPPDERGGGMGSIRLHGLPERQALDLLDRQVAVTGLYEPARGLEVETIRPQEAP